MKPSISLISGHLVGENVLAIKILGILENNHVIATVSDNLD